MVARRRRGPRGQPHGFADHAKRKRRRLGPDAQVRKDRIRLPGGYPGSGADRRTARDDVGRRIHAVVLAVSVDSKFTLRAYAEQEGYTFDLLADFWPHGAAASLYGVFDPDSGMALRGTFIIDAGGTIRYTVVNPRGQARDLGEYRKALAGLDKA